MVKSKTAYIYTGHLKDKMIKYKAAFIKEYFKNVMI